MRKLRELVCDALRKSALKRRQEHEGWLREKVTGRVMICDTDKVGEGVALFVEGVPVFRLTGDCWSSEKRNVTYLEALALLKELREAWVQSQLEEYDRKTDYRELVKK